MPQREADYRRIAREYAEAIRAGQLKPGSALPSIDAIADREQVSRSTVQRALSILSALGLVEGHQGKAVFVAKVLPRV
jgi:GntR family transcriptional repressor for pyruvate dehydrogenase complex